ncbi:MAG: hypothetical protein WED05_00025 [Candidatus Atabeyarchaeum deiterrae]
MKNKGNGVCHLTATDPSFGNTVDDKMYSTQITVDGVLCYYDDYRNNAEGCPPEPLLVTGLLSAMAALVREITSQGLLRKIESPPVKFFALQIMETPQVIVSMFTDISFPDYLCDIILGDISQFFLEKYVGSLTDWSGENLTEKLSPHIRKMIEEDVQKYSTVQPQTKGIEVQGTLA